MKRYFATENYNKSITAINMWIKDRPFYWKLLFVHLKLSTSAFNRWFCRQQIIFLKFVHVINYIDSISTLSVYMGRVRMEVKMRKGGGEKMGKGGYVGLGGD